MEEVQAVRDSTYQAVKLDRLGGVVVSTGPPMGHGRVACHLADSAEMER